MAKWPHVPFCYGWLGLDARGRYFMRDEAAQHAGDFASGNVQAKGSELRHEKLLEFIGRNYQADDAGQWYFQNGPQRVYVELESTPHIWRLNERFEPTSQTGKTTQVLRCLADEFGHVYLQTSIGLGLVHTMDVSLVADAITQGLWRLEECLTETLPVRFGYVVSPQAQAAVAQGR
jgi:hypothetical protein